MKKIIPYLFIAGLLLISCRKMRTCTCDISGTTIKTSSPRNGGVVNVQSYPTDYSTEQSFPGHTKQNMRRDENCNSKTISTSRTYTASISSGTNSAQVNDVTEVSTTDYNCSIK